MYKKMLIGLAALVMFAITACCVDNIINPSLLSRQNVTGSSVLDEESVNALKTTCKTIEVRTTIPVGPYKEGSVDQILTSFDGGACVLDIRYYKE